MHRSKRAGSVESRGEIESVVQSVVREEGGGENVDDEQNECVEAGGAKTGTAASHSFGEQDNASDGGSGNDDDESCAATGSYLSSFSDERYDLDYLASMKGIRF